MRSVEVDFDAGRLCRGTRAEPRPPGPGEVLFRVRLLGVCGTDRELAALKLGEPPAGERCLVIGHEALGEVIGCGSGVRGFSRGDLVVPTVRRSCAANCANCARGRRDLCLTLAYSERGIFREHGYYTEYAVDRAEDLIPAPAGLGDDAILLEPMSVVEKAVARGASLLQTERRRALVLGLGPIGILAACVLRVRGFEVMVHSAEPPEHPRTRLLDAAGVAYTAAVPGSEFELIVEAAGSGELALSALRLLAPCGAMVVLGAREVPGRFPFLDLLVKNQTVAGVVNSSRADFEAAAADLPAIPALVRRGLVERFGFNDFERTLLDGPVAAPKAVHVVAE